MAAGGKPWPKRRKRADVWRNMEEGNKQREIKKEKMRGDFFHLGLMRFCNMSTLTSNANRK